MSYHARQSLLADLHAPRPAIYWCDLIGSAGLGWASFAWAVISQPWSAIQLLTTAVATLSLYRALCFIHEISHSGTRLRWFEAAWNLLVGFPLLLPSFTYAEVHFDHHRMSTYGTKADPEYLPFARSPALTTWFCFANLFAPLVLCLRFLILTPIGLVIPRFEARLVKHASAITMNMHYCRKSTARTAHIIRRDSSLLLLYWLLAIPALQSGHLLFPTAVIWLIVTALVNFINGLRTLAAHGYESAGQPMERMRQVADSIDVPNGFWAELWAPVGLRYHAIHHCFPSIPYHDLPRAYRRLTAAMPETYGTMSRAGLFQCLGALFSKGLRAS